MALREFQVTTTGDQFYSITELVNQNLKEFLIEHSPTRNTGILYLFLPHTSCGILINESYDPSAAKDLESFYRHIAPTDLKFIEHTAEGADDSPSHMKTSMLPQHIALPVEEGNIVLGTWQGIYLAEFRTASKNRKIQLKFVPTET